MKRIFKIDWCLIVVFATTAITGVGLHIARHLSSHGGCHAWALWHTLASFLFIIFVTLHIQTHWGWYKSVITKGIGKKSKVTVWLSFIYMITSLTGIISLGVCCRHSNIGLWHYWFGIILTIIGLGHFLKRFSTLRKSLLN
jgi:hypothetical protein